MLPWFVRHYRRHRRDGQRGQSLVEFVLIFPVLLIMFLGLVEVGNLMDAYLTVVNAAREGARLGARQALTSDIRDITNEHAARLQLMAASGQGTIIVHHVDTDATTGNIIPATYSVETCYKGTCSQSTPAGAATTKLPQATLQTRIIAARNDAVAKARTDGDNRLNTVTANKLYNDKLVIVEVFYNHGTLTGFWPVRVPMYAVSIMRYGGA